MMTSGSHRREFLRIGIAACVGSVVAFGSFPAVSCIVGMPFNEETIDHAEIIFRGRPTGYEAFPDEFSVARLTFDVEETYRGRVTESWVAVWQNSTFGIPESLSDFMILFGDDVVVGLAPPGSIAPMDAPSAAIIGPKDPIFWDIPWVTQAPCAPPFMGSYSQFEAALRSRGVIE